MIRLKRCKGVHVGIETIRPICHLVVAGFQETTEMVQRYVKKELSTKSIIRRKPLLVVSSYIFNKRRAIIEIAMQTGAKEAIVIEETFVAAIGSGLPVWDATGSMIVDIGGGYNRGCHPFTWWCSCIHQKRYLGDEIDLLIVMHAKQAQQLIIELTIVAQCPALLKTVCTRGYIIWIINYIQNPSLQH